MTTKYNNTCFECDNGTLSTMIQDYTTVVSGIGEVIIPDVPLECCDSCDCVVIGAEAGELIDAYIDDVTDAITPREIQAFLDKYQINQKEAARITGYGEKTFSRWMRGHMRPSRSVSISLRTFLASREAFEIAKGRNWGGDTEEAQLIIEERQPDSEEKEILRLIDYKALKAMGLVQESQSPKVRRSELCQLFQQPDLLAVQAMAEDQYSKLAAYKDTNQAFNVISAGIWSWIGEKAASQISVAPYDRDKLAKAVEQLREYTQHDVADIIPEVQRVLNKAGVALVFVPIMKGAALRGCTKMVSPVKAVIVHGLKYRNHAQFWRVLFHEIAHLMLHLKDAGEMIADYEDQEKDDKEVEADGWADDTLVYSDELRRFMSRHKAPKYYEVAEFARKIKTHTSIVAEVYNDRRGDTVIPYSSLRMNGLYPTIPESEVERLGQSTRDLILGASR